MEADMSGRWLMGRAGVLAALATLPATGHAQVDIKAATAAIMQADREFNQAVTARDRQKFLSFIAEQAVFVGAGEMRGHDAILEGWSPFFDPDGATLTWSPTHGEVLVGGDVGYTVGSWVRRSSTPDGKISEATGQYVTTWQKQKDGRWLVVYDIGSTQSGR
jgi:uncharacterized protein (TIGR02246 family)